MARTDARVAAQHGFYARPAAHLRSLATIAGFGTIFVVQALFASFRAVS